MLVTLRLLFKLVLLPFLITKFYFSFGLATGMSTTSPVDESRAAGSSLQVTASSPTSLLSKVRAPKQLELVRKWKVMVNAPPRTSARKAANLFDRRKSECGAES